MKFLLITCFVISINYLFCQDTFHLKIDSLLYEGDTVCQIPEKDMVADIEDWKLILSGYSLFMQEDKTTEYSLAQHLGESDKSDDYTLYRSALYYNNPVPDHDMELYQYNDGSYKLVIISAAIITELYCTLK